MENQSGSSGDGAKAPQEVLEKADAMDDRKEFFELLPYLEEQLKAYPDDVEIYWRLCRCIFDLSGEQKDKKKELILQSLEWAEKTLAKCPDYWLSHKWMAIVLSGLSAYRSTKEKILDSVKIKEHALKAMELHGDGGDPTLHHLYGRWCYEVASISWIERKLAATLFATPPESSYEEALRYFLNANEKSTGPFIENLLWTGNAYLKLRNNAKAKEFFTLASRAPVLCTSDQEYAREAAKQAARL
jgi:tetratricopeptide (TPR) repeat protein